MPKLCVLGGLLVNPLDIFKLAMSALEIALKIADLAAEVQRARRGGAS